MWSVGLERERESKVAGRVKQKKLKVRRKKGKDGNCGDFYE